MATCTAQSVARREHLPILLGILILLLVLLAVGLTLNTLKPSSVLIDDPVPKFELPSLRQEHILLSSAELNWSTNPVKPGSISVSMACRKHSLLTERAGSGTSTRAP